MRSASPRLLIPAGRRGSEWVLMGGRLTVTARALYVAYVLCMSVCLSWPLSAVGRGACGAVAFLNLFLTSE